MRMQTQRGQGTRLGSAGSQAAGTESPEHPLSVPHTLDMVSQLCGGKNARLPPRCRLLITAILRLPLTKAVGWERNQLNMRLLVPISTNYHLSQRIMLGAGTAQWAAVLICLTPSTLAAKKGMLGSQQAPPGTGAGGLSEWLPGTRLGASSDFVCPSEHLRCRLHISQHWPSFPAAPGRAVPNSALHSSLPGVCVQPWEIVGGFAYAIQGSGGFVVRKQPWHKEGPRGWWVLATRGLHSVSGSLESYLWMQSLHPSSYVCPSPG